MAAWGVGRMAEPGSASPVLRALLRRGLTRQLSPEHLLGAWSGARHRGWESRVSRTLARAPPPPPTSLSQKQFLPTVQPGAYLPPTSRPGLQFPWSPLQWSSRPPGWVGPGLRGRRHCQGPPGKCCRLPRVLGKVFAGSPAPAALAVVDSFESRRGPRSMFATRPCACGEPVTSPTLRSRRARWLPRNPPGPWRAVGVWRPAVRASETAVTVSSVSQAGAEAGRDLGKRAV